MAITAVLSPVVLAGEAQADVGCYGDYCSGMDPGTTRCAEDAKTIAVKELTGAILELRYSPTCKTNWARYHQYPRGWYFGGSPLALRAVQDTGYTQTYTFKLNEGAKENETYWSPMIYSPVKLVRAEVALSCGDKGILASIADCAMNGVEKTAAG
ncbi:DUF2690 domain-containing protein [Streptomyces sp. NPDC047014]|uniref:DUF2690 domain-containing protein n=1 Tax=Streptomyces sp. NPDC047014 TaxID=3155736 RepID=UPI0034088B30